MKLSTSAIRVLARNSKGEVQTQPAAPTKGGMIYSKDGKTKKDDNPVMGVAGRSLDLSKLDARPETASDGFQSGEDEAIETAVGPNGSNTSQIIGRDPLAPILLGYIDPDVITDHNRHKQGASSQRTINYVYRDIYYHDPVAGSAVDLMSNMPFSDFSLGGVSDRKVLDKFEESLHNMNIMPLLPLISNEYLVHGMFVATTIFDESEGIYKGIVPQNVDRVQAQAVPLFGEDPLISLETGNALKELQGSTDPRAKEYLDMLPEAYRESGKDDYRPNPEDVIYIPRRSLVRDVRGVSLYRRILTTWFLERALYRGTLDTAIKRQRAVSHIVVGDQDWTPTAEEMGAIADMFMAADLDPVGAVFVTRNGVNVNDVKDSSALWKSTDVEQFFTTQKLRALGISEAFLSGESSFNNLEQVMTVFVEQQRAYRSMLTDELFYSRTFPRISEANNFTHSRYAVDTSSGNQVDDSGQLNLFNVPGATPSFMETSYSTGRDRAINTLIPKVQWHKRLRPEADAQYLEMLQTLSEKNIPIPVRIWAAAGGVDLDSILNQKDEDVKLREKLKDWMDDIKAASGGGEQEGGMGDFASLVTANTGLNKREKFPGSEALMESMGAQNINSKGKRSLLSRTGKKQMEERINRRIAEVASEINRRQNSIDSKLEENFRDMEGRIIYSIGQAFKG